ncbi:MAG: twin-arginine translocase subunit TatC [Acidobacteriota bacterium]|jgi:sec-independent protein translocase protein TatC|nr:twin-arginine translocase subunit TatC [Acidobacteriota bacterium]
MKQKKADEMTFFEHLGELRRRILISLAIVLVFFLASWYFVDEFYAWIARPVQQFLPPGQNLVFTALTEPFMMYIKLAFMASVFAASPLIFHQLWLFIAPGLYPKERRLVLPFVFFTTVFFLMGGAFGYYAIFPWACRFFLEVGQDFTPMLTINQYLSLAFRVIFGIAVVFELPVLVFLLARLGIITARTLIRYFKWAIVLIFVLAAVITPTPDMVTQSLFAGPMIVLYLLSIGIARLAQPSHRRPE